MNVKQVSVVLLLVASVGLSGCAAVLVGAGAAGGYALSKDSVKNQFDLSQDRLFRRSREVVKKMGQITLEDSKKGVVKGKVKDVDVTVTVKPLTKKTVELEVHARNKFKMPAVDIAQEVYNKIIEQL